MCSRLRKCDVVVIIDSVVRIMSNKQAGEFGVLQADPSLAKVNGFNDVVFREKLPDCAPDGVLRSNR